MGFLNAERAADLTIKLTTGLSMPAQYATIFTSWSDDEVDIQLAKSVSAASKFAKLALEDNTDQDMYVRFVLASLVIMDVYADEIKERGMNGEMDFPLFNAFLENEIAGLKQAEELLVASGTGGKQLRLSFDLREKAKELGLVKGGAFEQQKPTLH